MRQLTATEIVELVNGRSVENSSPKAAVSIALTRMNANNGSVTEEKSDAFYGPVVEMKKLANHVVLTLIFQNNNELRRTQSLIHAFETAVNEVNKDTLWFPILAIVLAPTEYAGQYGIQLSNPITSILSSSDVETLPDRISFVYPEDHVEFFYSKDPIR